MQVHVEVEQLELLERDAAVAMNDRLGKPGGAGREQDEQRMRERHLLELECLTARIGAGQRVRPEHRARRERRQVLGIEIRQVHHVRQRRQAFDDLADLGALVEQLAAVAVAVDAENELRARAASSGRARRARRSPGRSSTTPRRCSPWRTSRRWLRECWVDRPPRGRPARCRCRASRWRAPSPAARTPATTSPPAAGARTGARGILARPLVAQRMRRVVQPAAREPLGARHLTPAEHLRGRRGELQAAEIHHALPERRQVRHRPAPQRLVVCRTCGRARSSQAQVAREMRARERAQRWVSRAACLLGSGSCRNSHR